MDLSRIYARRFDARHRAQKVGVWAALHDAVFSRWIRSTDTVLDLGAGYCEFINAVRAKRRIAVDANPETPGFAEASVEVHVGPAADLAFLRDGEVDVVFSSNFLEHLPDKRAVTAVIEAAYRVLRPGGRIVLMGPNARLVPGSYWDFYDHHVPLTERSVSELLSVTGFELRSARARFLPYTIVRWGLPTSAWLVRAYVALMPVSSWFLGKQFLVVAEKP